MIDPNPISGKYKALIVLVVLGIPAILLSISCFFYVNQITFYSYEGDKIYMVKTLDHKKLPFDDFILEYERRGCEINKTKLEMALKHTMDLLEAEKKKTALKPEDQFKLESFEDHRNFTVEKILIVIEQLESLPPFSSTIDMLKKQKAMDNLIIVKNLNALDIF